MLDVIFSRLTFVTLGLLYNTVVFLVWGFAVFWVLGIFCFIWVVRYIGCTELAEDSVSDLGIAEMSSMTIFFSLALVVELCTLGRHSQFEFWARLCCPGGSWRTGIEEKPLSPEGEGAVFSLSWSPASPLSPFLPFVSLRGGCVH